MKESIGNPGYFKFHLKNHLEISKYYFARIGTSPAFLIGIFLPGLAWGIRTTGSSFNSCGWDTPFFLWEIDEKEQ